MEAIREEAEAIWNGRCIADEERFDQIRQVAEDCSGTFYTTRSLFLG